MSSVEEVAFPERLLGNRKAGREHSSRERRRRDDATVPDMAAVMRAVTRQEVIALPASGTSEPAWTWDEFGTDAALIERSLNEPDLFSEVFDRYYTEIHGYVSRRLGSGLADDVASETFLIAFDRRRRYDAAHPSARPWLYGIASNLVSRHHRAELRRYRALARAGAADVGDGVDGIAARLDAEALRGRLAAALLEVADGDREVLLLVAWAQLSCEEAARAVGIPAGTARSRLHRARRKTRAALAEAYMRGDD
jgi:RNA polymerase sigma factor (sigma-70 family)